MWGVPASPEAEGESFSLPTIEEPRMLSAKRWGRLQPILWIGLVVLTCLLTLRAIVGVKSYSEGFTASSVPRILWCYWDNPDTLPTFVRICMDSWKKLSPSYEVRMVTKDTVKEHSTFLTENAALLEHPRFTAFPARFSDLVRVCVLAEHGGVWIDASTLLAQPFEEWLIDTPGKEYYGFYLEGFTKDPKYPIIENWFFACPEGSEYVRRWRDAFVNLKNFDSDADYLKDLKGRGVNIDGIPESMQEYLSQHAAAQVVLQEEAYPLERLSLRKAEDGPYKYLVKHNWNNYAGLKDACENPELRVPFLKIRSLERNILEKHPDEFSNDVCHWI
jgi:hypothetical protein